MRSLTVTLLLLVGAGPFVSKAAGNELEIVATAATAAVAAGSADRRNILLGELTYRFQLRHRCEAPLTPQSIVLTIADTHEYIPAEELGEGNARRTVALPPGQIPPIAVTGFCAGDADGGRLLTLTSALSATASLHCGSEDRRSVRYAATPLDIVLVCEAGGSDDTDTSD